MSLITLVKFKKIEINNLTKATLVFVVALISQTIIAKDFYKAFFGSYGRDVGISTYILLSLILIVVSTKGSREDAKKIMYLTPICTLPLLFYGFLQIINKDFFSWNNPYSSMILTLGNPNFASALIALFSLISLGNLIDKNSQIKIKIISFFYIIFSLFLILESKSIQGLVILGFGILIVVLPIVWNYSRKIGQATFFFAGISTFVTILGFLNIGPLRGIIFQESLIFRYDYWRIGFYMFRDQPLVGIGQGKYGDVFSQYRDKTQVVHNVNVMTDSAHNTFVQFAASGGLILLLAYTGVVAIISKKVFRLYFSSYKQNVDVPIVALSAVWMGFLMQTLISPETTTLMYWGFFVGGLICAVHRKEFESEKKQKETNKIWKIIISFFSMAILTTSLYNSIIKSEAETQLQKALSLNIQNDSDQQAQYKARELLKVIDIAKNEMQYKYIVSEELLKLKYPQAAKLVVSSINSYSSDARALKLLARINLVENKTQEYIETLEKLKNIDPYNYKVKELMIQYYCKTGNNSKAQETVASINSQGLTKYISPKIKECLVQNDL